MSSHKRSFHYPQLHQDDRPWLKYPGPEKSSNSHSRSFSPVHKHSGASDLLPRAPHTTSSHQYHSSRNETLPLHNKRSSSRLNSSNSSNASLPMSLATSNSSNDSLGGHHHHHHHHPHSTSSPLRQPSKARNLSDELSFPLQDDNQDSNTPIDTNIKSSVRKATAYPSPITPSDLLGIPDLSSVSSTTSSSTPESPLSTSAPSTTESPTPKSDSTGQKQRPSPLSINTSIANTGSNTFDGSFNFGPTQSPGSGRGSTTTSEGPGSPRVNLAATSGPRTPKLTHSSSHSSTASNSSYSNVSSPSSTTHSCSVFCHHHSKGHHPHAHHHHHSSCHHNQERHHRRHHHPSCYHHKPGRHHSSRSDRTLAKISRRYGAPQFVPDHDDEDLSRLNVEENDAQLQLENSAPLELEGPIPNDTSTAVTIVGSTPAFGIGAFRAQDNQTNEDDALYAAEPPKKRQRSAAAVILGAAVETVIFTSAVALSAYQLLTGKGRQQLDATMSSPTAESAKATPAAPQGNGEPVFEKSVVQMKSAPVDIPTRTIQRRDSSSGVLGKSLHHNTHRHKSRNYKHSSYKSPRGHGLSISLPHAYDNDYLSKDSLPMPERPNTGTEDNDEQFLRMEAKLTTLIAEGKRALNRRISDWADA